MAITQSALAHAVARDFLRAASPEAGIKRVWVWSQHGYIDPERDYIELTVLAAPATEDAERNLLETMNRVSERYPDANVAASLLGPKLPFQTAPAEWMHPDAEEIDLGGG